MFHQFIKQTNSSALTLLFVSQNLNVTHKYGDDVSVVAVSSDACIGGATIPAQEQILASNQCPNLRWPRSEIN